MEERERAVVVALGAVARRGLAVGASIVIVVGIVVVVSGGATRRRASRRILRVLGLLVRRAFVRSSSLSPCRPKMPFCAS